MNKAVVLWLLIIIVVATTLVAGSVLLSKKKTANDVTLAKDSLEAERFYNEAENIKSENLPAKAQEVKDKILPAYNSNPKNPLFVSVLAWAEFNLGNYAEATKIYQELIALDSTATNYNNLGNALRENQNIAGAVGAYQKALELDPKYNTAYQNLYNIYLSQNWRDKDDLVTFLRKMAEDESNDVASEWLKKALNN